MIYLGIDPGLEGAIAIWNPEECYYCVRDMPRYSQRGSLCVPRIVEILREPDQKQAVCCIEKAQTMPKQGSSARHTNGVNYGIILGVLATIGMAYLEVPSSVWKRKLRLTADKGLSIQRAVELFPHWKPTRKKDHNQAEALLLAWYLCERLAEKPHKTQEV